MPAGALQQLSESRQFCFFVLCELKAVKNEEDHVCIGNDHCYGVWALLGVGTTVASMGTAPGEYNRLLTLLIEKAVVWDNKLEIEFKTAGIRSLMEGFKND